MTMTNFTGLGLVHRDIARGLSSNPSFRDGATIDASGELAAWIGTVWHPSRPASFNIKKVHFRCGTVTFDASSVVQISLQDVSATAGPPFAPDGTPDQTASMTSFTANDWNVTGDLSANRTVNQGDRLCVVAEYTTFVGTNALSFSSLNWLTGTGSMPENTALGGVMLINTTGSWISSDNGAYGGVIYFECDDGSLAFLQPARPFSAVTTVSVGNAAAIRRAGLYFTPPVDMKIEMLGLWMGLPNGCDGSLILYDTDGSTALVTRAVDNDSVIQASTQRMHEIWFEPITLQGGSAYRFAFVPSTATTGTVSYADVPSAAVMDGLPLGSAAHWTQHDGTNWTQTTTRRPFISIGVSALDDGAGGGTTSSFYIGA